MGDQYRDVLLIGPLWFMRAGRRFGVHFFVSVDWIESMAMVCVFARYTLCTWLALVGVVRISLNVDFGNHKKIVNCSCDTVVLSWFWDVYVALKNGFPNVRVHALVDASKRVAAEQARLVLPKWLLCKYDDAIVHGLPQRLLNLCLFITHLLGLSIGSRTIAAARRVQCYRQDHVQHFLGLDSQNGPTVEHIAILLTSNRRPKHVIEREGIKA